MKYEKLKQMFQNLKHNSPTQDLTAHIVFTEDSFNAPYPLLHRTYRISSDNKAFWPNMGGYSIFGDCLDRSSDQGVRLDWYMAAEGNQNGWKVQYCYILEQMKDASLVPCFTRTEQLDGTICYYFGDTCIQARESSTDGKVHLEPLAGDQVDCGEWIDLTADQVYGYCTLLERYLNGGVKA